MDLREKYIKNETAVYKSLMYTWKVIITRLLKQVVLVMKKKSNDYEAWYLDNNTQKD